MPKEFPKFETQEENPREKLARDIRDLLQEKQFSINPRFNEYFAHEIENTDRFVTIAGHQRNGEQRNERFLKIPINEELDEHFKRQIELTEFLEQDGSIPIRRIIDANVDRAQGLPFAIMETFDESDARIGYISSYEGGELLAEKEAKGTVEALKKLHEVNFVDASPELLESLKQFAENHEEFRDEIMEIIDQKVKPLDPPGGKRKELFHETLGRRFGAENYKAKVQELLERWQNVIQASIKEKPMLVHGDLGPGNIYVHDTGEIEPLDYEQAGISHNEIIATVIDFGNFRARSWNNPGFQESLDSAILDYYKLQDKEEVGKAIVSLGILRSHMLLSGFFENYPLPKQREEEQIKRREETEDDIIKAWKIAGLEL